MSWNRLIRFVDDNDVEHFGEPEVQDEPEITSLLDKSDLWATIYDGASPVSSLAKGERVHVKALRPLLTPKDVPIIRCIGLNYVKHSNTALPRIELWQTSDLNCSQGGWQDTASVPLTFH